MDEKISTQTPEARAARVRAKATKAEIAAKAALTVRMNVAWAAEAEANVWAKAWEAKAKEARTEAKAAKTEAETAWAAWATAMVKV